ncbi:MAG: nuclear transport factor 2 family protein [Anaerolineae bacterium]|nr:nuclear transport factor 2 family protein [Anaerolineae bacterium]
MNKAPEDVAAVRAVLEQFQAGYTRRDVEQVEAFMRLFSEDARVEVIGTNGIRPGVEEWYQSPESASKMIRSDWEGWGDVSLDTAQAAIHTHGDTAWLAAWGQVTQTIPAEQTMRGFLDFVQELIGTSRAAPQELLLYILRGGTNTLYELGRGETFTWPLRFTAVLVREDGTWKFHQVHFSLPTVYFPDVREVQGKIDL